MSWILDTGQTQENSIINITLSALETIFVIAAYNYTISGMYNVTAVAQAGALFDSQHINITV